METINDILDVLTGSESIKTENEVVIPTQELVKLFVFFVACVIAYKNLK